MNEDKMNRENGENTQDFNATQNSGWGETSQEEKKDQMAQSISQAAEQQAQTEQKPAFISDQAQPVNQTSAQETSGGWGYAQNQAASPNQGGWNQTAQQGDAQNTGSAPSYHSYGQARSTYDTQGIYGGKPRQPRAPKEHRPGGKKRVARFFKGVGALVLVAAVSVGSTVGYLKWIGYEPSKGTSSNSSGNTTSGTKVIYQPTYKEDALTSAQIYEENVSSVVAITSQLSNGSGVGTGIIMREDGYIITNDHVVADALSITVRTYDGTEYEAQVVGTDEKTDIAVIKIDADGLKAATFGDSDQLVVGEPAVVIGNPLGLEFANTMTQGAISSTSRDIQIGNYIMNVIQTDASINPGNSGGPLFNSLGEVVGVVSSKINTSEAVGIGFAIPSNTALKVANDFIEYGAVQDRPMLGVTVEQINSYYGQMQGIAAGLRVAEVVEGGAAQQAGIQSGDYIVSFNGEEVTTLSELNYAKDQCKVGDTVKVGLVRNGKEITVDLVLKDANQLDT